MVWNFDKDDEWKNTPKGSSSWNFSKGSWSGGLFNFTKNDEWKKNPEGPDEWNFTPSPNKIEYNEGELIAGIYTIPTFNFTGIPCTLEHIPCGYWWRFPIYSNCYILTSKLYPIFDLDELTGRVDLIEGSLSILVKSYDAGIEELETTNIDLISGELANKYHHYEIPVESIDTNNIDIISGTLKNVYHNYSIPLENIECTNIDIVSGILKDVYVRYTNGIHEDITTTNIDLVGGSLDKA